MRLKLGNMRRWGDQLIVETDPSKFLQAVRNAIQQFTSAGYAHVDIDYSYTTLLTGQHVFSAMLIADQD